MKRVFSIILSMLSIVMLLSLCACGEKKQDSLIGTWQTTGKDAGYQITFFSNGSATNSMHNSKYEYSAENGTLFMTGELAQATFNYKIVNDELHVIRTSGSTYGFFPVESTAEEVVLFRVH